MNITVNNKHVELHFGMRFLRELNEVAGMKAEDRVNMGMGLNMTLPALLGGDYVALENVIYSASNGSLTLNELDEFLENNSNVESLREKVLAELRKSAVTKVPLKKMETQAQ